MDHPSQIFDRIRRLRARADLPRQGRDASTPRVAPAPAQFHAAAAPPANPRHGAIPRADRPAPAAIPTAAAPSPAVPPTPAALAEAPAQSPPGLPPRPARGHALYSQVMRSHDRMGTRHL